MNKRPEKIAIRREIRARMETSGYVILTDCRGLNVAGMTELRRKLRGQRSRLMVVPNSFLTLAGKDLGWDDVSPLLDGPTAMVTGEGDVSQVAKLLREFSKVTSKTRLKGGRFEGQTLSSTDVESLADLPPREVLYAHLVGTLAAPMSQLVGVLQQKVTSVVYVLKAVADKKAENANA